MVPRPALVIHERRGVWARQLRPRLSGCPIRWFESRSIADLVGAVGSSSRPLVVFNLGPKLQAELEDLNQATLAAPKGLFLVLDPDARPGVATLARELGATHVWPGVAPPPAVADLLGRWIELARRRAESDGWYDDPSPEPQPWLFLLSDQPDHGEEFRRNPASPSFQPWPGSLE